MTLKIRYLTWAATVTLVVAGCSDEELNRPPSQNNNTDAGQVVDSGSGPVDSGLADAGMTPVDAGMTPVDAGMTPPNEGVETLDVGTIATGPSGDSEEFTIDIPDGTTSFMVLLKGPDTTTFIIKRMTDPMGQVLVSDDDSGLTQIERFVLGPFGAQFKSPNRVIQDVGISAALFPDNPMITVSGGAYRLVITGLTISGNNGLPYVGDIDVSVLYRTEEPTAGLLPVTLYFTGAGNITAESAQTDSLIQDALVRLGEIYAQAGLSIGVVTYVESEARFRTIEVGSGGFGVMEEMFATTAGQGPGLHFFFVDRFEGGFPGGMIAGISGGLPGPALAPGTGNSGVAVAITTANNDSDILAHVMAHEGGHWLGLFHTSEITGTEDQMPDTPAGQAGDTHLMYPAVGGGTMVSTEQSVILRRHMETIAQ